MSKITAREMLENKGTTINVIELMQEHTKQNIEALREELKSNGRYKHFKPDRDTIDKISNQFLENIK